MLSCDLVHLLSQIAVLGVKSRHIQRLAHKLQYMRKNVRTAEIWASSRAQGRLRILALHRNVLSVVAGEVACIGAGSL